MLGELEFVGTGLIISEMTLREGNGDRTVTSFTQVSISRRFGDEERGRVFGIPGTW